VIKNSNIGKKTLKTRRAFTVKQILSITMVVIFFFFLIGAVFSGSPPSSKLKLPAKYEAKQRVVKTASFTQKLEEFRLITVIINSDGTGKISTEKVNFSDGSGRQAGEFEILKFEIDGENLIVIESSPKLNNLHTLKIVGDEYLETSYWFGGNQDQYKFETTLLKRVN